MIRPYADNVLVRMEPADAASASGVVWVRTQYEDAGHDRLRRKPGDDRLRTAVVVAVGPGWHMPTRGNREVWCPTSVREGDRVLLTGLAGDYVETRQHLQGYRPGEPNDYRLVREQQIEAILEGDP